MEHAQPCLIVGICDLAGVDEEGRAAVYYAALLVNVAVTPTPMSRRIGSVTLP
jgi:hypothetical protein